MDDGKAAGAKGRNIKEMEMGKKARILCLHGYRTSGSILRKQIEGRWPHAVLQRLELVFLDAPFPARGKSGLEPLFDPPYYEWFHSSRDFREYWHFDECVSYIEDYMLNHGPFDGLLGFSQGALIAAAAPGMQAQGAAFTRVPKINFLILISASLLAGYEFRQPKLAVHAFSSPIQCPSLHIIGEMDFLKPRGIALLKHFMDPVVIYHLHGHIIPRLDEKGLKIMLTFIERIQNIPLNSTLVTSVPYTLGSIDSERKSNHTRNRSAL